MVDDYKGALVVKSEFYGQEEGGVVVIEAGACSAAKSVESLARASHLLSDLVDCLTSNFFLLYCRSVADARKQLSRADIQISLVTCSVKSLS